MSSSSSTVPAKGRARTIITWALFGIWGSLMTFGAIALLDPPWLQAISHPGVRVEARDAKDHADTAFRNRDLRLAIANYQRALKIRPDYGSALTNLGIAFSRAGDFAQAEQSLQRALPLPGVDVGVVHFNLAEIMTRQARSEEAIQHYREAIAAGFDPNVAYRMLGGTFARLQRWREAAEAFEAALRSMTDIKTPYHNMLYSSRPSMDEDSTLREPLEKAIARGVAEADMAIYDVELIRALQANDQEVSRAANDLAVALLQLGEFDRAEPYLEQAVRVWPGNEQAQKNLAALREMRRQGGPQKVGVRQ